MANFWPELFVRGDASTAVEVDAVAELLLVDGRGLLECFEDDGDACVVA